MANSARYVLMVELAIDHRHVYITSTSSSFVFFFAFELHSQPRLHFQAADFQKSNNIKNKKMKKKNKSNIYFSEYSVLFYSLEKYFLTLLTSRVFNRN